MTKICIQVKYSEFLRQVIQMDIKKQHLLAVVLMTVFAGVSAEENEYWVVEGGGAIPELDCIIQPSETVDVGSAVAGVVESIHAYRSDLVSKGDVVVELKSSVERATLELARTRATLNTAIKLRQESAAFGHVTQQRKQELLQKAVISRHEMDQLKTETRIAELQVRQEKDNKRIAGLEFIRAQAVLQQRTIRSPVTGVVMERFKSVGEYVEDGPLLRIAQLDPLHVEVIVSVDYLGRIVPGMTAEVTLNLLGSGTYLATVERVDRVADAASGTYGVHLSLSNPEYKIAAGLRCEVNFLPPEQTSPKDVAGNTARLPEGVRERLASRPAEQDSILASQTHSELITADIGAENQVTAPPQSCYTYGPVQDKAMARKLLAKLETEASDLFMRHESGSVASGFYVVAKPGSALQEGAASLNEHLKSEGIVDLNES